MKKIERFHLDFFEPSSHYRLYYNGFDLRLRKGVKCLTGSLPTYLRSVLRFIEMIDNFV